MQRVEKTVFISYRHANAPWALAVFQNLTNHGYDVFYDVEGVASGDFEQVILGNIRARAHFVVLLTPSALEGCNKPGDWLRREIETAIETKRNIVPLMFDRFCFDAPSVAKRLTGTLALLKKYNGLEVHPQYFGEAMNRLRQRHLNVALEAVLHPASDAAQKAAEQHRTMARSAPPVREPELSAQEWFERGQEASQEWFERGQKASSRKKELRCYSEAIRLDPKFAYAYLWRGIARRRDDLDGALRDLDEAIRLDPKFAYAYVIRGTARHNQTYDLDGALRDLDEAIRLDPKFAPAYHSRGLARRDKPDLTDGALRDFDEAIRLDPNEANYYYDRALVWDGKKNFANACADYQKFLDLGGNIVHESFGGVRIGNRSGIQERIKELKKEESQSSRSRRPSAGLKP